MKEFKTILETYKGIDFSKRKAALATVVQVRGSSYRSPGARMLMLDNGRWVGSISGGCLEGDALRKSRKVIMSNQSQTVTYDTTDDDDNKLGIGLGCNGIIDILIEPIDPEADHNPIKQIESFLGFKNYGVVATVFESHGSDNIKVGDKSILLPEGNIYSTNSNLTQLLDKDLDSMVSKRKSETKFYKKRKVKVFFEVIQPGIDLLIFGGGFDAKPVTELANVLGWNVTVSDECVAHLIPINFPKVDQMVSCQRDYVAKEFDISPFTAIVLMSHNLNYDKEVIMQIIKSDASYIGILGPKNRAEKLIAHMENNGIEMTEETRHKLHYPIGLDIGAETPDEIAVSIISEIQAKFSNRTGGFLKYRKGPIHLKDSKDDQVFKQVYLKNFFPSKKSSS
ncbi:MAG: xanthine dehydrogenase accessory factor [Cyclobacteriaceae bacterium]